MENINIEEIMEQIRREIKEKGLTSDMLSFEDVPYKKPAQVAAADGSSDLSAADEALARLNAGHYVQPYKPLAGNPFKVFIKKVIRKLTKFYVEPVVFEQNEFNANAVSVLNVYRGAIGSGDASKAAEELAGRVETLELAQKELLNRLDRLEKENSALREALSAKEPS